MFFIFQEPCFTRGGYHTRRVFRVNRTALRTWAVTKKHGITTETVLITILEGIKKSISAARCVGLGILPAIAALKLHHTALALQLVAKYCTGFVVGLLSLLVKPGVLHSFLHLLSVGFDVVACLGGASTVVGTVVLCIPLTIDIIEEILHPGGDPPSKNAVPSHLIQLNSQP